MFTNKQLDPPTEKQLSYINVLETKTGLIFCGSTKQQAIKFIDKANQVINENKSIKRKIERENERFPFPDLSNDLPTKKQWDFIKSLEDKTKLKFRGSTKKDATIYIDYAKRLLEPLPNEIVNEIDKACSIILNKNN
jgi:hypothetical protein